MGDERPDINSIDDDIYMVRNELQCNNEACDALDRIIASTMSSPRVTIAHLWYCPEDGCDQIANMMPTDYAEIGIPQCKYDEVNMTPDDADNKLYSGPS